MAFLMSRSTRAHRGDPESCPPRAGGSEVKIILRVNDAGAPDRDARSGMARRRAAGRTRRASLTLTTLSCLALLAAALVGTSPISGVAAAAGAPMHGAFVVLSGSPGTPAVDTATGTIYVPIMCPESDCPTSAPGRVVDVISAANCSTAAESGCRVEATAPADDPTAAAVDEATDTVYLANAGGTVTLLNGARCNATVTSGCGVDLATVKVGGSPVNEVIDPLTSTLYLASPNQGVFVVDLAACSARSTAGCGQPVKLVKDPGGPDALDVDLASDTVYVTNGGVGNNAGNGDSVSIIDGATCNGSDDSGCGRAPHTVTVGSGANWITVDQADDTIYAANFNDGTVSVLNGADCNAIVTSGCASTPHTVVTGEGTAFVEVDEATHTLFTLNQDDNTLSEMSTTSCQGSITSGCPNVALNEQAAPETGPGYDAFPNTAVFTWQNDTAYLVDVGGDDVLSVLSVAHCNAIDTSGCRVESPSVPDPEYWATIDPATGTLYASNDNEPQIDVFDATSCDPQHLRGCAPVAKIAMKDPADALGPVDDSTHTLYVSDPTAGTVAVIDTALCNAARITGCTRPQRTITIGPLAGSPVLNPGTDTLYVPYGSLLDKIAVVDIASCNAEVVSGCHLRHGTVRVGEGTNELALSAATDTLYAPSTNAKISTPAAYANPSGGSAGDTVDVINGSTCNGTDFSGCAHVAATVTVGTYPFGVAVDDATHTVYVADNRDGDLPGELTMIDSSTCNGFDTTGCHRSFPSADVGRSPRLAVLDGGTGLLYVTDRSSAAVSVLDTARCNAQVTTGCPADAPELAVGSKPVGLAVDQVSGTAYVMNVDSGTMSLLDGR